LPELILKEVTNMCIIAYAEKRRLTHKEFSECFTHNRDGVGFAWFGEGMNHYVKGMTEEEEAWKFYEEQVRVLPHVAHFRIASTGEVVKELTHPFIVDKNSPIKMKYSGEKPLLFHNGTISGWQSLLLTHYMNMGKSIPDEPMSDTRVAAMIAAVTGRESLRFMSGRFVYWDMAKSGRNYIIADWKEEDGAYFSNDTYKPYVKKKPVLYDSLFDKNWDYKNKKGNKHKHSNASLLPDDNDAFLHRFNTEPESDCRCTNLGQKSNPRWSTKLNCYVCDTCGEFLV
jgi:hypothetical protein